MAHKKKVHDPMKYKSEQVQSGPIYITRTYKEKRTKRIDLLRQQFCKTADPLTQMAGCTTQEFINIYNSIKPTLQRLSSEEVATFLIANNIAQRKKPLHASTAIKKLEKMRYQGSINAFLAESDIKLSQIKNLTFSEDKHHEHNLHYFLYKKYGVMLLNASTYDCCTQMIEKYKTWGKAGADKLRHYENFAKKFYAADILVKPCNQTTR